MHDDLLPAQALLLAWLAADTPADRQVILASHADMATPELAEDLLDLAQGGPSYGGDRRAEATFQVQLLELAVAVAELAGAEAAFDEARQMLAASLSELPGSEAQRIALLTETAEAATKDGRWLAAHRAQWDLAHLKLALGRGREALDAFEAALEAALADHHLLAEAGHEVSTALAEETLEALVRLAGTTGRHTAAKGPIQRFLEAARRSGDRHGAGRAATVCGQHLLELGFDELARPALETAAALLGEMGDDDALVRAHLRLLAVAFNTGDAIAAAKHMEEVLRLRERVGDPLLLAEIEDQFGRFF